jgi:hypothetical protein
MIRNRSVPKASPPLPPRRRTNEPVKINGVRCLRDSEKAIYVVIPAIPGRRADWRGWIPQSQVHDDSEVWREGDHGQLVVTRWIAEQKGLAR